MDETIQDRLRARMRECGLNENATAVKAGLNRDAVRDILRGKSRRPGADTLQALAAALGCSVIWLMTGEDAPSSADLFPAEAPHPVLARASEAAAQGDRLRRLRLHFDGGSTARAAEVVAIPHKEWLAMEGGHVRIDTVTLARFCEHHQIGPAYVVTGSLDALPAPLQRALAQAELAEMVAQARMASALPAERHHMSEQTHTADISRQQSPAE